MLVGLGLAPRDLAPGAPALEGTGMEERGIDAGVLARTMLIARLLPGAARAAGKQSVKPAPFAPLRPADVRAFEGLLDTPGDAPARLPEPLRKQARAILDAAAPAELAGAAAAVADRWIASLAPLDPVLVKKPAPAPSPPSRKRS
jgi:hypothetical protein